MTIIRETLSSDVFSRLGWVLLHSLWQFALIALVLAVVLELLRYRSAEKRYIVCCVALSDTLLSAIVTFTLVLGESPDHSTTLANVRPAQDGSTRERPTSATTATSKEESDPPFAAQRIDSVSDLESDTSMPKQMSTAETANVDETAASSLPLAQRLAIAVQPWLPAA